MRLETTASAAGAAGAAGASGQEGGATPGPAPAVALALFGPAFPLAERYADLLAGPGIIRGLIGPREAGRLWERHLLNCAQVAELIPRHSALVDIGSGAGLPGLVLAMMLPDVRVTLIEPLARRVTFLEECVSDLELANVRIRRARAEDVAGEYAADVVTARAVAPLDRLTGLAVPLVRPGGVVLALKGERAGAEAAAAAPVLRRLGVSEVSVLRAGTGQDCAATIVVRMVASPPLAS
jgi:16S rRNA (guanine527-N7)-methyltransferase